MNQFSGKEKLSHLFLIAALAALGAAHAQSTGPVESKGLSTKALGSIDLSAEIEGLAGRRGQQAQRMEAEEQAGAECLHPGHHHGVDHAGLQPAPRAAAGLGAGRTGGGHRDGRPLQAQRLLNEGGQRVWCVQTRVAAAGGEAAVGVELAVGGLGIADGRR